MFASTGIRNLPLLIFRKSGKSGLIKIVHSGSGLLEGGHIFVVV